MSTRLLAAGLLIASGPAAAERPGVFVAIPATGTRRAFGAFARIDTPDPVPGNHVAKKTFP
jgi:hypothetical protein